MQKNFIATAAVALAASLAITPAAEAGMRGVGLGLGVGLGTGLLVGAMQQQAMAAQQAEMQKRMMAAKAAEMQRQKAKMMAAAKAQAEAKARMEAEARTKAAAEAKAKAIADANDIPPPAPGKLPADQKADVTASTALVRTETGTSTAPDLKTEEPKSSKGTKTADCRKFVPSVGMTINVPCN